MNSNNQLENALNQYIKGQLSLIAYRQKRTRLIQEFTHENADLDYDDTIPQPRTNTDAIEDSLHYSAASGENAGFHVPTIETVEKSNSSSMYQYLALVVLVLVAIVTWYFADARNAANIPSDNDLIITSPPELVEVEEYETKDGPFIIEFLKKNKWTSESLSDFLVQWQSLTRKQQATVRQSPSFLRLSTTLQNRIQEQRALKENNNKVAERQESLLIWFAAQLSISLN